MRRLGLWLLGALGLPGPVPRESELCPCSHRVQLHPAPAEEQGPAGLGLHRDLHSCQWLRGDGAASRAGPLLLPGPRGRARRLSRQHQHLFGPQVGSDLHLIEPLDEGGEGGQHAVYPAEQLLQTAGTCGVSNDTLGRLLGPRTAAVFRSRPRDPLSSRDTRYVELYVVVDNAEFQQVGSEAAVRHRVLEVVNHVDKLYQKLNIRVVLVGLEIWNGQDRFHVSPNFSVTLENLLAWRAQGLTQRRPHDNVQLITAVDFTGDTVGFAKVSAMCSHSSGAVNQDHSKNPVGVACTMAHEMGHNLGMDHDEQVHGCRCREPSQGMHCVMAGRISSRFPRMFSDCSQAYLESFLEQPQSTCLASAPDLSLLVGGPVCGNLFVERGEQCDCGPPEECRNHCCNSTTCQLVLGAQCAHGTCCQECRVKPAGELCRPQKDTCDLEEFCDGRHPECPEDAFQENGTPCFGGYCYNGTCPTLAQRCQALWGPGGHAARESCFFYDISPNCRSSWNRADMCGALQCQGGQQPPGRSSCILNNICRALTTEGGTAYEPVPEGTQCGPEKVCNHKQECHCHAGWAPPHCTKLLTEAHTASESLPVVLVVVLVLLAVVLVTLVGGVVYRKARSRVQSRSVAPKTTMGRSNPLFHQASSSALARDRAPAPVKVPHEQVPTTHLGQPAGHPASSMALKRPPPASPAAVSSTPFPVPVYTQQAPKQGAVGPKVALKPPIQRNPGAGAPTVP
uniref:Tubulin gamma complex component 2 n=1 Tax=Callithrix jacchus TaxID=9483 RepID=A0A2R8MCT4_CALJA